MKTQVIDGRGATTERAVAHDGAVVQPKGAEARVRDGRLQLVRMNAPEVVADLVAEKGQGAEGCIVEVRLKFRVARVERDHVDGELRALVGSTGAVREVSIADGIEVRDVGRVVVGELMSEIALDPTHVGIPVLAEGAEIVDKGWKCKGLADLRRPAATAKLRL